MEAFIKKRASRLEFLKETNKRHKFFGTAEIAAIANIEAELLKSARKYMEENGFTEVVVPHITRATGACENIDTMFEVDFFGQNSYLLQTGQLYLEALIPAMGNVFCIGPSFRAEPDVDSRHLTEFTLVEFEGPFDFEQNLVHIENIMHAMVQGALKNKAHELLAIGSDLERLEQVKLPFGRITYTEAIEKLQKLGMKIKWGDDLKSRHEKILAKDSPVFVTHFPVEEVAVSMSTDPAIKFFNMRQNDEDPRLVNSADLLLPGVGESVGSAEREHRYGKLMERLSKSGMLRRLVEKGGSIEDFRWYFECIQQRSILHSGCGIGMGRVMQFVLGTGDIRTSTVFPMNRESLM